MRCCVAALLVGLALAIAGVSVSAQSVITVGQATSNNIYPFRSSGNGSGRYQTAYGASELPVPPGSQLIGVCVGMIGLFVFVALKSLEKAKLLATKDPYFEEGLHHHL